jgi:predicted transcriptional regulator
MAVMTEMSESDLETKFLIKIYEDMLSRQSSDTNETTILLSITNVANALGVMTKGSDNQELFGRIIDSLVEKGFVKRYATNAVAITLQGIKAARKES